MSNFKTKLAAFRRSGLSQRDNLQELVQMAMTHAQENQDEFTQLSQVMATTVEIKSFRTATLKDYIKAHVSNVTYTKNKAGDFMFKKEVKGTPCEYKTLESKWYDFDSKGQASADIDVLAQAKALLQRINKGMAGTGTAKIKEGQEKAAQDLQQALAKLTA
ncbi:hypothetical protein RIO-1_1 [Pseudoalteromonas phage RIO-1]|uniref:Uncharacterized protein n=1 Tax=Pseudoalteromonas phage RIO-1 TaxID=1316739 RepID=R4JMW9_9CAUD|nr:hypothetical protein RIO-1_1 [Pseudoalteromonas phage RIO-1]AGK87015.1 hypothetical protein RIO-1_1 [Pseudoalteromonas phage RIO-1]